MIYHYCSINNFICYFLIMMINHNLFPNLPDSLVIVDQDSKCDPINSSA